MTAHIATDVSALLDYLESVCRYSPHTIRAYRESLDQYAAHLRKRRRTARTATFDDVLAFAASMSDRKASTAALRLAAVRKLHAYLHAVDRVDRNVAALVPSPKHRAGHQPAPPNRDIAAARAQLTSSRDRALFGLMYGSALRISEVRGALAADVSLADRTITFIGKGNVWRTAQLDAETRLALAEWLDQRGRRRCRFLFPTPRAGRDEPISERPIRDMLRRAARDAGLDPAPFTPHALRRAIGRGLRTSGASREDIQALYGHRNLAMTDHYLAREHDTRTLPETVRDRLAQLERPHRIDSAALPDVREG